MLHGVFEKHEVHGGVGLVVLPECILEDTRHGIQGSNLPHRRIGMIGKDAARETHVVSRDTQLDMQTSMKKKHQQALVTPTTYHRALIHYLPLQKSSEKSRAYFCACTNKELGKMHCFY